MGCLSFARFRLSDSSGVRAYMGHANVSTLPIQVPRIVKYKWLPGTL